MTPERNSLSSRLPEGAKIPREGSRKRKIWDAFWQGGEDKARKKAQQLEIKESTFRQWLSNWRMLARGELPAWMRKEADHETSPKAVAGGFAEAPLSYGGFESQRETRQVATMEIGQGGRIIIPAAIREQMNISEGSKLVLLFDGEELRLFTPETGIKRAQKMLAPFFEKNKGRNIVDELIEDRRREAAEEDLD